MKKSLIFICGLLMSLSAFAQTSVTVLEPHMVNDANKVIIKERPFHYPYTITCSNSKEGEVNKVTFIYNAPTMQVVEVTMEDYYVNDMVVDRDSVFFCGKKISTKEGIIGYFDIDDVFANSGQIYIESGFVAGESGLPVLEFTRLIHFSRENGAYSHVASIGICDKKSKYPCLIDLKVDYMHTYVSGCVYDGDESFTDLKLVRHGLYYDDLNLVTAGYNVQYGRYINIRVYNFNNFFSLTGPQDMCHVFCMDTGYVIPWLDGGVLLSEIENNIFATVSYRATFLQPIIRDDEISMINYPSNIHLAFYNLSSIYSNSVYGMTSNYEISASANAFREMNQFLFNPTISSLAFLHTFKTNSSSQYVSEYTDFKLPSLPSLTTIQLYSNPGIRQSGLSLYNSNVNYILSGYDQTFTTVLHYQMNKFNTLSRCANKTERSCEKKEVVASHNFERPFSFIGGICITKTPELKIDYLPLYIECETE